MTTTALVETESEEEQFARLLVKWHGMQTRAYMEWRRERGLGIVQPQSARVHAHQLANRPIVKARVAELMTEARKAANEAVQAIIAKAREIVEADPSELTRTIVHCCRYCYGQDHRYQFTAREYERKWIEWSRVFDEALAAGKRPPEAFEDGGVGYDKRREPHPDCPECGGHGVTRIALADTSRLSPGAAALFAGVKQTKEGLEVKFQDQQAWAEKILKVAGAYVERRELSGPGGGPIQNATLTAHAMLTATEGAKAYAEMVKGLG